MGRIGRLLAFIRSTRNGAKITDAITDPGGGPNVSAEHFSAPGDDAFPLLTDYVAMVPGPRNGGRLALGYVDPLNTPVAQEGDKRIYARDADTGAAVVEVWLKNSGAALVDNANGSVELQPDGTSVVTTPAATFTVSADGSITGSNGAGSFILQADGTFNVNGATIDPTGAIASPVSVAAPSMVANSKELAGHAHAQGPDSGGNTEQNTGGNL